jgi:hypothetical protein
LRVRNDEVAFGGEADINGRAGLGGSVANDPKQSFKAPHSPTTKC